MKKQIAIMISVMIVICPCVFAEENVTDKLFIEFENYLHFKDDMLSYQLQALEYVDTFMQTQSYDDLMKARIAVQASMIEVKIKKVPGSVLSDNEYFMYEDMGADVGTLGECLAELSAEQLDTYRMLGNVYYFLTSETFYQPQFENYKKKLEYEKEIIMRDILDTVYFANDFLLVLGRGEEAAAFWKYMKTAMPALSLEVGAFIENEAELWELAEANQLEIEKCINELEVLSGLDEYVHDLIWRCSENNDFSEFRENRTSIQGMPEMTAVEPFWIDTMKTVIRYFYTDPETGAYSLFRINSDMNQKPTLLAVIHQDDGTFEKEDFVTFEDVFVYCETLIGDGWSFAYEIGEDNTVYCQLLKNDSKIQLEWTQEICTLYALNPVVEFVPFFY